MTIKAVTRGHCLVCTKNLLDERRCLVFRRSRKHKDTCRCGHLVGDHEPIGSLLGGTAPADASSKVPPALLRVARAFDELRDATLAVLSGRPVTHGVMQTSVERSPALAQSPAQVPVGAPARAPVPSHLRAPADAPGGLARGPRAIMTVIAQAGPGGATRQQIAVLTGYKTRSITTYISAGRQLGYIEPGSLVATPSGVAALGPDYKPLPTGDKLREYWLEKLPQGELRLFEVILSCYPGGATRSKMKEMTGYAERSITTYVSKLVSRQIIRKVGRECCAADILFTRRRESA